MNKQAEGQAEGFNNFSKSAEKKEYEPTEQELKEAREWFDEKVLERDTTGGIPIKYCGDTVGYYPDRIKDTEALFEYMDVLVVTAKEKARKRPTILNRWQRYKADLYKMLKALRKEEPKEAPEEHVFSEELQRLIEDRGEPVFENESREISQINEAWWALYYASTFEGILLERNEQRFYTYNTDNGLYIDTTKDSIRLGIADLLLDSSRAWRGPKWMALAKFRSSYSIDGIINHLRGEVEEIDPFQNKQTILHLANCVLRFDDESREFVKEEFSPDFRSRNMSPISYNPEAKCPEFIKRILGHVESEDRELMQRYAGQCLLGNNLTQRILMLTGEGGASKGAFINIIREVTGRKNAYELRTEHLAERFEIGRMIGKTLLLGADVKPQFLSSAGAEKLKALVGGDLLEAELKGSNKQTSVDGRFNVMISANTQLKIRLQGDASAWRRRLTIVSYDKPFAGNKIPNIHEYLLTKEGEGILNWCIEGAKKLLKDIELHGDIALSQAQKDRVEKLLAESDSLQTFVNEEIERSDYSDLASNEILLRYMSYCEDREWDTFGRNDIERQIPGIILKKFQIQRSHSIIRFGKSVRGYRGLKFRNPDPEDE